MRRKTYAYNSIIIGVLIGILVYVSAESAVLGILAGLGVAVAGFIVIRLLENAVDKGVNKAAEKVGQAYQNHKAQKAAQAGVAAPQPTQFPNQGQTTQFPGAVPVPTAAQPVPQPEPQPAEQPAPEQRDPELKFCPYCGAQIKRTARFCPACGAEQRT